LRIGPWSGEVDDTANKAFTPVMKHKHVVYLRSSNQNLTLAASIDAALSLDPSWHHSGTTAQTRRPRDVYCCFWCVHLNNLNWTWWDRICFANI